MAEKAQAADSKTTGDTATPPPAPRRPPGHRSTDVRDTVAEMAARAQEISQEAGSKVAQAMRDVINAAAGLAGFAIESARDLVQYMVRRGQMTQEEADRLIREAEEAYLRRKPVAPAARPAPRAEATKPAVTQSAAAKKTTPQKTAKTAKASAKKTAAAPARAKTSRKTTAAKKRK